MVGEERVLGIVLAGGAGKRLMPLTADRAKPAVPFGGAHRLVDFVLSNLVNGGMHRLCVLTQYKSHSLDRHISSTWRMSSLLGHYVTPVPAQQRRGPYWYQGSADAIYQSLNLIHDESPDYIVVFGADHVYRMDPRQMLEQHIANGAGATVAGIRVAREQASAFGVIDTKDGTTISAFLEKPSDPPGLPDDPDQTYVSMGNYIFDAETLVDALRADAADESSAHDMGGDIIPMLVEQGQAQVYDFDSNVVPGETERDHRRLLRRPHGPDLGAPDLQPVQHELADLRAELPASPGEVRRRRARVGLDGVRRLDHLRRAGVQLGDLP